MNDIKEYKVVRLEVSPEVRQMQQIQTHIGVPITRQMQDALKVYFKLTDKEKTKFLKRK